MKRFTFSLLVIFIFMASNVTMADTIENNQNKSYGKMESGTYNNIAILIRFKGENEFLNEVNSQELNGTYNYFVDFNNDKFADLGSISLKSYINDLTYGNLNINTSFYPKNSDTKYYSIEAPYERSYYEEYGAGSSVETELVNWAFDSVKTGISLSGEDLDRNNDGYIDMVTFIVNGNTVNNDNMLWSHETNFQGSNSLNGKNLGQYNLINTGSNDNNIFNKKYLNIVTHEFLHMFDYPDLYRYYSSGNPVGPWDIMAESIGYGQMPLVYTKDLYSNLNINVETIEESGTYTLSSSQSTNKNDVVAYKIKTSENPNEYFMIEFRKNIGNWDSSLPGSGIVIYRVNENVNSSIGNRNGSPDSIYVFRPNEYNSKSAGGYVNGGFFSEESGRTTFGSSERSDYFIDNSLFYSNGQNSGIVISEIGSSSGETISFKVNLQQEKTFKSFIGINRYETASLLNNDFYKNADTAILVNGNAIADGLSVSPIATYLKAPIFLTYTDYLSDYTLQSLKKLGVKNIIIAGGDGIVSNKVVNSLKNNGISNITRLGGKDRYETSILIAKYIDSYLYDIDKVVIANGYGEADAMSVSTFAGRDRMPIILSGKEGLTSNNYNYLKNENLSTAYIVGGDGVISNKVINDINKITINDISQNRLGGSDRYETNLKIIERFNNGNLNNIYLSVGGVLADSLVTGPISALNNGVIILTRNALTEGQVNSIEKMDYNNVIQAGGGVSKSVIDYMTN